MQPVIVWFRRNLRLADNAALVAAADSGAPVIAAYVHDELDTGGASRWWLRASLGELESGISGLGGTLNLYAGDPAKILTELLRETGASGIYCASRYEAEAMRQENSLRDAGVDLHSSDDSVLHRPGKIQTGAGGPYKVFTPYYRSAAGELVMRAPQPCPSGIEFAGPQDGTLDLDALGLVTPADTWAAKLADHWQPGEAGAHARLDAFRDRVNDYGRNRDRPDVEGTSKLSPHLHFGELSPIQVLAAVADRSGSEPFVRQLYWRDFSQDLLFRHPDIARRPLRGEYASFPWQDDRDTLRAWQRGETGIDLVDAGMRELWATGWMHNRVRMVVASFLTKNLLLPWQAGLQWFEDTLVDADAGNNGASWQWVAGCGTDAAPYFRVFNPDRQADKFDPDGSYRERWLGGTERPAPIVDLIESRARALDAYQLMRDLLNSGADAPR